MQSIANATDGAKWLRRCEIRQLMVSVIDVKNVQIKINFFISMVSVLLGFSPMRRLGWLLTQDEVFEVFC